MRITAVIVCLTGAALGASAGSIAIEGGAASFVVGTTVPGISVKGKSTSMQGHAVVQSAGGKLHIENIDANVPVKSLATGMSIRDEHMRRYIFTLPDGQTPDLHFEATGTDCTVQ